MSKNPGPDKILICLLVVVISVGVAVLASVSAPLAYQNFGDTFYYLKHQLLFGFLPGLAAMFFFYKIKPSFVQKKSFFLYLANFLLMAAVFLPLIGSASGGATRWLKIGGLSFQPAEFFKFSSFLYLASLASVWSEKYFSKKTVNLQKRAIYLKKNVFLKSKRKTFAPGPLFYFLLFLAITSLPLIAQEDASTLLIVVFTSIAVYFLAGAPLKHFLVIAFVVVVLFSGLVLLAPYRFSRMMIFLGKTFDPVDSGYQLKQSLISIGSGGISGVGLGMSSQRFGFVPAAVSDAIFPILAEETGFIGSCFLIILFLLIASRGFKIIKGSSDKFSGLAVCGFTVWLIIQAFLNIASMLNLAPIMGIPLPWISYGGTAFISQMAAIGFILNVSRQRKSA